MDGRPTRTIGRAAGVRHRTAVGRAGVARPRGARRAWAGTGRSTTAACPRNGTFVNGHRVAERRRLRDGDTLRFGATAMVFRRPSDAGRARRRRPCVRARTSRRRRACSEAAARGAARAVPRRWPADARAARAAATNPEIAAALFLSLDAIKGHLRGAVREVRRGRATTEREAAASRRARAGLRLRGPRGAPRALLGGLLGALAQQALELGRLQRPGEVVTLRDRAVLERVPIVDPQPEIGGRDPRCPSALQACDELVEAQGVQPPADLVELARRRTRPARGPRRHSSSVSRRPASPESSRSMMASSRRDAVS